MEEQNSFMNPTSYPVWCQQNRKTVQSAHLPYPGTPDYTYPGGLRIKEINNYDSNDELLTRKHYYYTKEFTPTTKGGVSSGILSFTPQYLIIWSAWIR